MAGVVWITIVKADMYDVMNKTLFDAINTEDLAAGQTDRITDIINEVCDEIRADIQNARLATVSATAHTIPPELKHTATMLVMEHLALVFPTLGWTDEQHKAWENANKRMELIRTGKSNVSLATDAAATDFQAVGHAEMVRQNTAQCTRDDLAGL